ncbi:MAG: hypothetical protein RLN75_08995 [Longimicrobiales bacterium]
MIDPESPESVGGEYSLGTVDQRAIPTSWVVPGTGSVVVEVTALGGVLRINSSGSLSAEIATRVTSPVSSTDFVNTWSGSIERTSAGLEATITQTNPGVGPNTSTWRLDASGSLLELRRLTPPPDAIPTNFGWIRRTN